MIKMLDTIIPKSDQMNADDLHGGPRTVKITDVVLAKGDQPASVYFEGDNGRPYKPCKTMRRVMSHQLTWGGDEKDYIGKSMTLFCDPKVTFGAGAVGGIRISHMSHISESVTMWLTEKKGARKPYTVHPLVVEADKVETGMVNPLVERIHTADDVAALEVITADAKVITQRAWLADKRPELAERVNAAVKAKLDSFAAEPQQGE